MFRDMRMYKLVGVTVLAMLIMGLLAPETPRASVATFETAAAGSAMTAGLAEAPQRIIRTAWAMLDNDVGAAPVPTGGVSDAEAVEIALRRHAALHEETDGFAALAEATEAAEAPEPEAPEAGLWRVTGTAVNLRAGPGTGHEIVGSARLDDRLVPVGDPAGSWVQVETAGGGEAWIHSDFLTPAGG